MKRFYLRTFGCKLNQADSASIRAALVARGLHEAGEPSEADLIIINTCTVTSRADRHARQAIRKLKRSSPNNNVFITGCYSERAAGELAAMPEVDDVFGLTQRQDMYELLGQSGERRDAFFPFEEAAEYGNRTRAFLKIQEGCNLQCSYCIVRFVRGKSRSLPRKHVIGRLRKLFDRGFREVVLTGTHIGLWGKDLNGEDLVSLLREIAKSKGLPKIRICSMEPDEVNDELLELIAGSDRIACHLHLAVQSGSAEILNAMRRTADPPAIARIVNKARGLMPSCGIGADVIVGFPGETDEDFAATVKLLSEAPFTYAHVFPFSLRPGTEAAAMPDKVHPETVTHRSAELRAIMREKNFRFRQSLIGHTLPAVALASRDKAGRPLALTDNYIHVIVEDSKDMGADLLHRVLITAVDQKRTIGRTAS